MSDDDDSQKAFEPNNSTSYSSHSLSLDWRGAWSVAILAWFWLYPQTLIGLHWQDTSEFIGAGRSLAVAHPPGHPLTLISIHLTQLLPWLDASARAHLASSFWGGFGTGCTYLSLQALLSSRSMNQNLIPAWKERITWGVGALITIGAPLVWLQAIRAEVYASQWALSSLVWTALIYAERAQDRRGWVVGALALGALAANHTLLTVALSMALIPRLLTLKLPFRVWWMSISATALGVSLYLYVWWRGRWGGVIGWGWIDDFSSWWNHVSAKVWQHQVGIRAHEVDIKQNMIQLLGFSLNQVGLVVGVILIFILILGSVRWVFRSRTYHDSELGVSEEFLSTESSAVSWGPTFALATLGIILTKLTYPLSTQNPDFSGYLASGVPSALLLLACAIRRVFHRPIYSELGIFLITLGGIISQHQLTRPPESAGAEAWGRQMTTEVPTGGFLWSSFYSSHFITSALWVTEGWRPDLRLAFRGHRKMSWANQRIQFLKPLSPHPSLEDPQIFFNKNTRYEVERSLDAIPHLWSQLSIPGDQYGQLTCTMIDHHSPSSQFSLEVDSDTAIELSVMWKQTQNMLSLGDLRTTTIHPTDFYLSDEDTAYAWALHHELNIRWISERLKLDLSSDKRTRFERILYGHQMLLERWLEQISLENWNEVDFSWSNP